MARSVRKYALLFLIGSVGYAAMETIWRGYTHWSMVIAGGLCFILFSVVSRIFRGKSIFLKAGVCAVGVTAIEFIFGLVFNIWLKMDVWDYSHVPFNILGQICPIFSLIWAGIAIAFLPLADLINKSYA